MSEIYIAIVRLSSIKMSFRLKCCRRNKVEKKTQIKIFNNFMHRMHLSVSSFERMFYLKKIKLKITSRVECSFMNKKRLYRKAN